MRNSFLPLLSRFSVVILLLVFWGCQKRDDAIATPQTITDRILEDSQFGLLRAAIEQAGISDVFKDGNLTLFAPTDSAFQAAGLGTIAEVRSVPPEQMRTLVLYHLLTGSVMASEIPAGMNSVETLNKGILYINKATDGTIYVNNARLTQADIKTANGYIHVVNRVLMPSIGNILTNIQNNPNLTFLTAAIKRIGTSNPALLATLENASSANKVTIFAPNDAAFKADKVYNTLSAITSANVQMLTNVLLYHVITGARFSTQFKTESIDTFYTGNKLITIVAPTQVMVKGAKNLTAATIKQADLPATNGVIHIIDQVLQP
jgi:uncharacterized surface protein with fasciclin (FAS1) repeats